MEAASASRFASCFAPARKDLNGTNGRRAPCAWFARNMHETGSPCGQTGGGPNGTEWKNDTRDAGGRSRAEAARDAADKNKT